MPFHSRLQKAFPIETYANTLRALREGIASADDAIKGIPMLDNPVGRDYRGLLRRAGIFHRLREMCRSGDLPFKAEFSPMPYGSWHWLDIWSGDVHSHIVRTEEPDAFPEDTPNRQDQRATNIRDLFEDDKIINLKPIKLYAWLCYKVTPNGALAHALWQSPSAKVDGRNDEWLARINILNVVAIKSSVDLKRPAAVDPTTLMALKDEVVADISKADSKSEEK